MRNPRLRQQQNQDQINGITSYIDGSNIYGSTLDTSDKLRSKVDGKLLTHEAGGPTLPTRRQCGFPSEGSQKPEDLVAGDERAIVQPTLASIHSLFLNEHNRVASELKSRLVAFLGRRSNVKVKVKLKLKSSLILFYPDQIYSGISCFSFCVNGQVGAGTW